jgi:hypothetical protein
VIFVIPAKSLSPARMGQESSSSVIPAKAGIQKNPEIKNSRLKAAA